MTRRGAGVVERAGLENRSAGNRTVGSNPTLSANFLSDIAAFGFAMKSPFVVVGAIV
jgi:hypothetical protein